MPTQSPERRPHTGLNRWHVSGICLICVFVVMVLAWMAFDRGKAVSRDESLPGITTGIAPSDANSNSD